MKYPGCQTGFRTYVECTVTSPDVETTDQRPQKLHCSLCHLTKPAGKSHSKEHWVTRCADALVDDWLFLLTCLKLRGRTEQGISFLCEVHSGLPVTVSMHLVWRKTYFGVFWVSLHGPTCNKQLELRSLPGEHPHVDDALMDHLILEAVRGCRSLIIGLKEHMTWQTAKNNRYDSSCYHVCKCETVPGLGAEAL